MKNVGKFTRRVVWCQLIVGNRAPSAVFSLDFPMHLWTLTDAGKLAKIEYPDVLIGCETFDMHFAMVPDDDDSGVIDPSKEVKLKGAVPQECLTVTLTTIDNNLPGAEKGHSHFLRIRANKQ
jgi:hypothetical protein